MVKAKSWHAIVQIEATTARLPGIVVWQDLDET